MPITIDDATPDFLAFWDGAQGRARADQERLWHERYAAAHRDVLESSGGRYGSPEHLPLALARYPAAVPRMRALLPRLRADVERLSTAAARLLEVEAAELRWTLLVGMFWADGWMTVDSDGPVCALAVEMIEDGDLARITIAHEAAHACHLLGAPEGLDAFSSIGHNLFLEGLAVDASARLVHGYEEGTYLWPGRLETAGGQPVGGWVADCEAAWPVLRDHLLGDLDRTDDAGYGAYFLGAGDTDGMPVRAGYFAGSRLVTALAAHHSLPTLVRWSPDRAAAELADLLGRLEHCPPPRR